MLMLLTRRDDQYDGDTEDLEKQNNNWNYRT